MDGDLIGKPPCSFTTLQSQFQIPAKALPPLPASSLHPAPYRPPLKAGSPDKKTNCSISLILFTPDIAMHLDDTPIGSWSLSLPACSLAARAQPPPRKPSHLERIACVFDLGDGRAFRSRMSVDPPSPDTTRQGAARPRVLEGGTDALPATTTPSASPDHQTALKAPELCWAL